MRAAGAFPAQQGRILAIQGMLASDTAHYGHAVAACTESGRLAKAVRNRRQQAFSEALLGRVHLLRGDVERAAACLDQALEWIAEEHWTAFEPFVTGLRGETYLADGRVEEAAALIDRSWVMAELAGDHCYMALAAGAEARLFLAHGDLPPQNAGSNGASNPRRGISGTRPGCWTPRRKSPSPGALRGPPSLRTAWPRWRAAAACGSSWCGRSPTGQSSGPKPPRRPCRGWRRRSTTLR